MRRSRQPAEEPLFGPPRKRKTLRSLGCRIASQLGWLRSDLRRFGGLSPSPQLFLGWIENRELALQVVAAAQAHFSGAKWYDLVLHFGFGSAGRLTVVERTLREHRLIDILSGGCSGWEGAAVHKTVAEEFGEVLKTVKKHVGTPASGPTVPDFVPGEDFRSLRCNTNGKVYEFTTKQACAIAELFKNWEKDLGAVSDEHLLDKAGAPETSRLRDVFRGSDAWGEIVVRGDRRGTRKLFAPKKS